MFHAPFQQRVGLALGVPLRGTGILLVALLVMSVDCAVGRSLADEPKPGPLVKQPPARLRDYLPVLLKQNELENERELIRNLINLVEESQVLLQGGFVEPDQLARVEQGLLQGGLRRLRREREYRDSLDLFTVRFSATPARLRAWDKAAISPLTQNMRRFENLFKKGEAVQNTIFKAGHPGKVSALRAVLEKELTTSDLFKDTRLPVQWASWKKREDLLKKLRSYETEKQKLRNSRDESLMKDRPFPPAERKRLGEVESRVELGRLEWAVRQYESHPWKDEKNEVKRFALHARQFRTVCRYLAAVVRRGESEQIEHVREAWPALAPLRLDGVDLLTCTAERADKVVTMLLKAPEAALAGRRKVRRARELTESYPIQQRAFALALLQMRQTRERLHNPSSDAEKEAGPLAALAPPAPAFNPGPLVQKLLDAQLALSRAKDELTRTWIEYQMVRLALYQALKQTPP